MSIHKSNKEINPFSPSWIRQLEFRTETEDFLIDKQEYLLRYRPNMPGVRKAQSNLIEKSSQELNINYLNYTSDVNRYLLDELLTIRTIERKYDLIIQMKNILLDEKELIANLLPEGSYNLKDLIQIDKDLAEIEEDIFQSELRLEALGEQSFRPNTSQIISIKNLASQFENFRSSGQPNIDDLEHIFEMEKINAEIELEKAEERRIFDYIQLRYNGPHSDLLKEKIALGIGIEFPHSSDQKLRLEELRVEQLILEQEMSQQQKLDSLEMAENFKELKYLLDQWLYQEKLIRKINDDVSIFNQSQLDIASNPPELILYHKKQLVDIQIDHLELENDIYDKYLDILEKTLILSEPTFLSYILEE